MKPLTQVALAIAADDRVDGQRDRVELRRPCSAAPARGSAPGRDGRRAGTAWAWRQCGRSPRCSPCRSSRCRNRCRTSPTARPTARSPCQWNSRCIAVGDSISGIAIFRPSTVTDMSIVGDSGEHVGHEVAIVEGRDVAPQGHLVVGAAVDIVEHRPRQPPLRQPAEILDIVAIGEAHGQFMAPPVSFPQVRQPSPARFCSTSPARFAALFRASRAQHRDRMLWGSIQRKRKTGTWSVR